MTTTMERTADVLHEAVGDRLVEVASTAGDVMRGAGEVVRDADRTLRGSPDQVLGLVAALSVGMAVGFVASGSSRLLVGASLVPAVMVAVALAERIGRDSATTTRRRR